MGTTTARLYGPVTLDQVALQLGLPRDLPAQRRLARLLRARGKRLGIATLWMTGTRLTTTAPVLRLAFPEWFDRRDRAAELMAQQLEGYDERLRTLELKCRALGARLRELEKREKKRDARG